VLASKPLVYMLSTSVSTIHNNLSALTVDVILAIYLVHIAPHTQDGSRVQIRSARHLPFCLVDTIVIHSTYSKARTRKTHGLPLGTII